MIIDKQINATAAIYALFLDNAGKPADPAGNLTIKIYDNNDTAPDAIITATMVKKAVGFYSFTWNYTSIADGLYEARISADDTVGNVCGQLRLELITGATTADVNKISSTALILTASFSDGDGYLKDPDTSATVTIYPANSDTPVVSAVAMTKKITGYYYYEWDITEVNIGNYTARFDFTDAGAVYSTLYPFLIINYEVPAPEPEPDVDLTFPTLPAPAFPVKMELEDPSISSEFENGSEQTRARFTRQRKRWNLSWPAMTNANRDTLMAFYASARGGSAPFYYTDPYNAETHIVRFDGQISEQWRDDKYWQISATLKEA